MSDDSEARKEDYWERVEADAATVVDHLEDDADDWDIIAVDVAGDADDGNTLFLLVIRRKVSEGGHLLISERYYKFDVLNREGKWVSNGIERRVSGSLPAALKVLYTALDNGDLQADDPMLMDSREDGLNHTPESLNTPVSHLRGDDTAESDLDRDPRLKESSEGDTSNTVVCNQCDAEVPRDDAINLGGGMGLDIWTCEGKHVSLKGGDDSE